MMTKFRQRSVKRIVASFGLIMFFFSILSVRLIYVQVFSAQDLSARQSNLMTKEISLTATRGDILDRNRNILASDASCSMISVYPNAIPVGNDENVSRFLSEELGLTYNEVYAKVSNKKLNNLSIKRGVDNATALKIREANISGIVITEDKKRYYTDPTSAQYILGFVGVDHTGRYGIEAVFNDELKGVDGSQRFLMDSTGRKIESGSNTKVESVPGNDIVLSIDRNIQYYTEKAVYEGYLRNGPKRVVAIVSNPNTGEILAMAAYPSFDLDNAWEIDGDYAYSYQDELSGKSLGEKQLEMWRNPFTSFIYEPGSTFKSITVSSALESNTVSMDSTFYCSGSYRVDSITYKCHVFPRGHGSENLTDAIVNSCNPAMMQIALRMGPETFYKYIRDFGFGKKTGIKLDGEEAGILIQRSKPVDYVTLGYGQGIGVTPIQMIMADNAVVNGGHLYEPLLVDSIINPLTKQVIDKSEPKIVRNVVSKSTSDKMRDMMHKAAESTSGLQNYQYLKIGGKTGTAQKIINGAYSHTAVIANYFGFAPYDNPKYSVLVLVDEPTGANTMGSTAAAPIAGAIFDSILNISGTSESNALDTSTVSHLVPDLRGKAIVQAKAILGAMGIPYNILGVQSDEYAIITEQTNVNSQYANGMIVDLKVSSPSGNTIGVPNLKGMTVGQANAVLTGLGLKLEANGGGIAISQSMSEGSMVEKGETIIVIFKYIE